jgi:3-methyladenine DNA glycosylase AlkD
MNTQPSDRIDAEALAAEIDARLQALPDRKTDTVRALRKEFTTRLRGASAGSIVKLGLRLMDYPDWEHHFIAYELIASHEAALRSLGESELILLGAGMASWWEVDTFAPNLSGVAWREGQIGDEVIRRWAKSPDRWWRRAALVSTIPLNMKSRGGVGDAPRTLAICKILVDDRDDMVVKALSWALRELGTRDPDAVRAFLVAYGERAAPRVRREVNHKLDTGLKNPRKLP